MSVIKRPDHLEKESIFVNKIEADPNICNSCYRKIREHNEPASEMPDSVTSITEYEDHTEFGYFDDFVDTGRPNIKKAYCECGAVDWNDVRIRPMDQEQMEKSAMRIARHLKEKEVDIDESEFLKFVKDKGKRPEYQFKEEKVFEEAVKYSTEN